MKLTKLLLMLMLCCSAYSAIDVQSIAKRASQVAIENGYDEEDDLFLVEFYTDEINNYDPQELMQNPELVFRRGVAWFETANYAESAREYKVELKSVREDFDFVKTYSDPDSRMAKAAQVRMDFIDYVLAAPSRSLDDLIDACVSYQEVILRRWATNPKASGSNYEQKYLQIFKIHPL